MSNWLSVLLEPAKLLLARIGGFLASALLMVIILIIGWLISRLIKTVVEKVLRSVKLDWLSDKIELDSLLAKGGIKYSLSELIAVLCYWIGLLVTFVVAFNAIDLPVAAGLLEKVVFYVPNIILAVFILILGMFLAIFLRNVIQVSAKNAGIAQANLLAKISEFVIIVFSIFIALEQLQIAIHVTQITLTIILGTIGLALALAFGLGCKDLAAKVVADFLEKIKK